MKSSGRCCRPAAGASAIELQQMAFYLKFSIAGQFLLQFIEIAGGKINNPATARADKVVMVLNGPPHQITPAVATHVYLADKTEINQQVKHAVNGHLPDLGVLKSYPVIYGSRGKMVMALRDYFQYGTTLRSKSVSVLPHYAGYFVGGEFHPCS